MAYCKSLLLHVFRIIEVDINGHESIQKWELAQIWPIVSLFPYMCPQMVIHYSSKVYGEAHVICKSHHKRTGPGWRLENIALEKCICQLLNQEVEAEQHYVCHTQSIIR